MGQSFKNAKKSSKKYQSLSVYLEQVTQALHINSDYPVDQFQGLEYQCRMNGLNVIHGGDMHLDLLLILKLINRN